jgi:hypothetical protein
VHDQRRGNIKKNHACAILTQEIAQLVESHFCLSQIRSSTARQRVAAIGAQRGSVLSSI